MKRLLIKNIGLLAGIDHDGKLCLKGKEMAELHTLPDAYLVIENGRFTDYGKMNDCPPPSGTDEVVDAEGGTVLPHGATPIHTLSMLAVGNKNLLTKSVDLATQR